MGQWESLKIKVISILILAEMFPSVQETWYLKTLNLGNSFGQDMYLEWKRVGYRDSFRILAGKLKEKILQEWYWCR